MARTRVILAIVVIAVVVSAVWGWRAGKRDSARMSALVIKTVDGDTIDVRIDDKVERVRIIGADTPETKDPRRPVQCFGPEASAHTKNRLLNKKVSLELDADPRDRYGRLLAYVYIDGERYEDELLRLGLARLLIIAPNDEHGRALAKAELDAKKHKRGLWGACDGAG
jgi:micrococcal nuclease